MVNFGFSAYLKILCLNERPRRRALKERLMPSEGGYDFHKSLGLLSSRLLAGESWESIQQTIADIKKAPERRSVQSGLEQLMEWRAVHRGALFSVPTTVFEDPSREFSVRFAPNFGLEVGGQQTAIHIWNTIHPDLVRNFVHGALYSISTAYVGVDGRPADLAVLSLRDGNLYRLSEARDARRLGESLSTGIGIELRGIRTELGIPEERRRPSAPPAPPPAE
ncbi:MULTISPECIES: hypothetical protein [unclassified Xanthobacter]|uniref:hypothetical protein n=1 Tax=unclassified Xanthobacter TaxID=2623496 RepID=UPI001F3C429A|nr:MULTISPECIES: hypothetical protein [unclassified Xanthobacter]